MTIDLVLCGATGRLGKEILIDLGYNKSEIENLRKEKVIFF